MLLSNEWKIFSNFVTFSEYPNFMYSENYLPWSWTMFDMFPGPSNVDGPAHKLLDDPYYSI